MKKFKLILTVLTIGITLYSCSNDDDNSVENVFVQYQGEWQGSYTGGDSGIWTASIDSEGIVTGNATSSIFNQTYDLNGNVSAEGVFTATVGTATSGATFNGQIDGNNVSGTWTNTSASLSGSWDGVKQ